MQTETPPNPDPTATPQPPPERMTATVRIAADGKTPIPEIPTGYVLESVVRTNRRQSVRAGVVTPAGPTGEAVVTLRREAPKLRSGKPNPRLAARMAAAKARAAS